jgi:hypothetical protein
MEELAFGFHPSGQISCSMKKRRFDSASCDPEGIQTPNLLIRSQMLYSVKLRDLFTLCGRKYSKIFIFGNIN